MVNQRGKWLDVILPHHPACCSADSAKERACDDYDYSAIPNNMVSCICPLYILPAACPELILVSIGRRRRAMESASGGFTHGCDIGYGFVNGVAPGEGHYSRGNRSCCTPGAELSEAEHLTA
jgi:hypothetical protein